jgi:hypothetical protein
METEKPYRPVLSKTFLVLKDEVNGVKRSLRDDEAALTHLALDLFVRTVLRDNAHAATYRSDSVSMSMSGYPDGTVAFSLFHARKGEFPQDYTVVEPSDYKVIQQVLNRLHAVFCSEGRQGPKFVLKAVAGISSVSHHDRMVLETLRPDMLI